VAVPFRVIRKGRSAAVAEPAAATSTAMGDGWDRPGDDDW
jgi:hypothetical protein